MPSFKLRTSSQLDVPAAAAKARELRRLDDGLHPPDISGLDLYATRDALTKHQAALDAVKADRARAANAAVSPWWRTRPAKLPDGSPNDWPPWRDIDAWRGLGASHALLLTPSRLETTHRPHERAYDSAYRIVFGAYMDTPAANAVMPKATAKPIAWQPPEHPPMMGPWRTSAWSTPLLDEAMCVAQEMIEAAPKSANNPHFNKKYADLASVIAAVKPACTAARIARYQPAWTDDKPGVIVTTRLAHKGEWCEADLRVPVDKTNAQALGSAITYGRRYGLSTAFGVSTEDDDGNQAAAAPPKETESKRDAIGPRCSGKGWTGDLGREVHQLAQDLATLGGADPMDVWWELLPDAGVDQQPYMDTDGAWPAHARVLSTSDGKLVKAAALKKIDDARQT